MEVIRLCKIFAIVLITQFSLCAMRGIKFLLLLSTSSREIHFDYIET
jgi:hypothetical protein